MNTRAAPESMLQYKLAIQLYKLYNSTDHSLEWITLNLNQIFTSRQTKFSIMKTNSKKVGLNCLTNLLSVLNGKIPLEWLNSTGDTFKVKCKKLFFITPLHVTKYPKCGDCIYLHSIMNVTCSEIGD